MAAAPSPGAPAVPHHDVVIVGAGFSGLGAAIRLRQEGFADVALLERAHDLGGTWRDNRYPGCACDVPSRLYSFSFARNPSWSRRFAPAAEIHAYLRRVAEAHGVTARIRTGCAVEGARWDAAARRWRVDTSQGPVTARVLVMATGALSNPVLPDVPGLDTFGGTAVHSAQWPADLALAGKRVVVVGTGASAIQVVPALQPQVAHLTLLQRTPAWIVPRRDRAVPAWRRRLYAAVPPLDTAMRALTYAVRELTFLPFRYPGVRRVTSLVARAHLRRQVRDPALREALTPRYGMGCKRVLVSDDFYPALQRPNVTLVPSALAAVEPDGVVAADGTRHPADVLVCTTGFVPGGVPPQAARVVGAAGRSLAATWDWSGMAAYASTTVAGFPNLFVIPGPHTGIGHTSLIYMLEAQVEHLVHAMRHMRRNGLAWVAPRPEAQAADHAGVQARMRGMVWVAGGCHSWYLDARGENHTLWPDFTFRFRRRVAAWHADHYEGEAVHA
ncbi:MAG: NAD(P)/FAD-dependent oxidoreductase [Gemmatimonadetes bacterium]|nr:NAD(P)/FAD-dependent oxidoreductase [Gemmatimonadota bacterium]